MFQSGQEPHNDTIAMMKVETEFREDNGEEKEQEEEEREGVEERETPKKF